MAVHCSKHSPDHPTRERYAELRARSTAPDPFSDPGFVEISAALGGLSIDVHFASVDGRDAAALMVPVRRIGPFRQAMVPRLTAYSSLAVDSGINLETEGGVGLLTSLADHLSREYDSVALHFPPAISDVRPFQWRRWETKPFYTYVLSIGEGTISEAFSDGSRRLFDRHRGQYETIRTDLDGTRDAVTLCARSYARHGRSFGLIESDVQAAADRLIDEGLAACFSAVDTESGSADAAAILLLGSETAYYWVAGSKPGASMTVLVGEMGDHLAELGISRLDMIGANTASIAEFKRRLGGKLVPYFRATCLSSRFLRLMYRFGVGVG